MKRLFIADLEKWEIDYLKLRLKKYAFHASSEPLTKPDTNAKRAEMLGVFIHTPVTESLLHELPQLKFITTMSTGFDHIDLDACKARGVVVSNVPSYGENTVAEHAFGLMLTLSRNLHAAIASTRHGRFGVKGLMGFDLKGKTLGVIGAGHIGQHVIEMARAFKMNVVVYTLHRDAALAKKRGFRYV